MSVGRYYSQCRNGIGRCVRIRTNDGRTHFGMIDRVTSNKVYLRPVRGNRNYGGYGYSAVEDYGGYGYGWWGPGWGVGWGFAWGIALGAITALAFVPLW